MNLAQYGSAVREKLLLRGFAALPAPPDLAARLPLTLLRTEEWGSLALALVAPERLPAALAREQLLSGAAAWVRQLERDSGQSCCLVLLFPFDRAIPEAESAAITALRVEEQEGKWRVISWVADLSVGLIDRPAGFPRVENEVLRALTDLPREAADGWREVRGGRSRLTLDLGYVPATRLILAATIAYYLWTILATGGGLSALWGGVTLGALAKWGALNGRFVIEGGQQWRLLTYILLHGGILHIGLNMWALWQLGRHTEMIYGSFRLSFIYIVSGVLGGIASTAFRPSFQTSVGASGAILGLMGALVYFALASPGRRIGWRDLILPVGINLALGFFIPGIDNYAHIGGFIGGVLAAFVAGTPGQGTTWRRVLMGVVGLGMLLLLTGLLPLPWVGGGR